MALAMRTKYKKVEQSNRVMTLNFLTVLTRIPTKLPPALIGCDQSDMWLAESTLN